MALRLAWARHQSAGGCRVWHTPEVLTWDAWLNRQWRFAVLRGSAAPRQLLSASQERALWEEVLLELAQDGPSLGAHANGLMRAAWQATQSLLKLSRSAMSAEEHLLVQAVALVRQRCVARGLLSLRLALPEELAFLGEIPAPAILGAQRLTPLQESLHRKYWKGAELLPQEHGLQPAALSPRRFQNLEAELAGCAEWCLARLREDGTNRLLILSACGEPSLAIQGELLWRHLAGAHRDSATLRNQLLSIEGGAPLVDIGLVAAALLALECLRPQIDTEQLFALLRSPYFRFGTEPELWRLQGSLETWARARWSVDTLVEALATLAEREPAAGLLGAWLQTLQKLHASGERLRATGWAARFNEALVAAGFGRSAGTDSAEQQRLQRWGELLDEFSGLDAVLPVLSCSDALERLQALARAGRHQVAAGDAAITLSGALGDPVIVYDGIWVLGLTESRWPEPPRPDPYVSFAEQRAQRWPAASVAERRQHALWALSRWQLRTGELILSYPEAEGELQHRPSAIPGRPVADWTRCNAPLAAPLQPVSLTVEDQQFPFVEPGTDEPLLRGGMERLRIQHQCPFRAQAQWRLGARAPGPLSDGLTPPQRGALLHALLQRLWEELQDQAQLLRLTPQAERSLLERHWRATIEGSSVPGSRWWPAPLAERERVRTLQLISGLLQLERSRTPFTVVEREASLHWPATGPRLKLRIDRIDRVTQDGLFLIDYKSGGAERIRLQDGELEPLQLALYVAALAARGDSVSSAALLSLKPDAIDFSGVAAGDSSNADGLKPVEDWNAMTGSWTRQLLDLIASHVAGTATLAHDRKACRYCHLPALCRRAPVDEQDDADE